jgi:hypothetical protein
VITTATVGVVAGDLQTVEAGIMAAATAADHDTTPSSGHQASSHHHIDDGVSPSAKVCPSSLASSSGDSEGDVLLDPGNISLTSVAPATSCIQHLSKHITPFVAAGQKSVASSGEQAAG